MTVGECLYVSEGEMIILIIAILRRDCELTYMKEAKEGYTACCP